MLSVFHFAVLSLNVYSLWYDQVYLDLPFPAKGYAEMPFKARYMFLTFWCLILQTVYFFVALLNDFFGSTEVSPRKRPVLRSLKDILFGLAFSLAIYVGTSFWGLYYFDKELIFPEYIERVFPNWLNHSMHTFIVIFILIELVFTNKNYPSRNVGLAVCSTFFISYLIWLHVLFYRTGAWVYPIFKVLNLPARIVFLTVSISIGISLYILGEKLNSLVCPSHEKTKSERKKR